MDAYEAAVREASLPQTPGCPELDAMIILNMVRKNPGLRKTDLAFHAQEKTGGQDSTHEELRRSLHNIDCLVWLRYLAVYDNGYHLTPPGSARLEQLRNASKAVMLDLAMGY